MVLQQLTPSIFWQLLMTLLQIFHKLLDGLGVSNVALNPNYTFHFQRGSFLIVTPLNAYAPGDNIVVIWPKADAPVTQSMQYFYNNLYVLNSSSTNDF